MPLRVMVGMNGPFMNVAGFFFRLNPHPHKKK